MGKLSGKIAVVTGAASGIGKGAVDLFRGEGAIVVGADVTEGADVRADAGSDIGTRLRFNRVANCHVMPEPAIQCVAR
jgi:NAD(P)-dependent dehydrogenase (short-subunit alcohol dehydrogenase family)